MDSRLDVQWVRARFPQLDDWALFENAGGTLAARPVLEQLQAYMTECQVQPGAAFRASAMAAERMEAGHRLMAEMVNAHPEEVVLGPSTTMNVYVLAHAIAGWFSRGDEIIVTDLDHEANNGAWRRLADKGLVVREWQMNPDTCELEVARLEQLLNERTRLVCFTHCSNITGAINDVAAMTRLVHDAGALVCVDAVAYAPHRLLDVRETDVDFYACSLYKLYGPHQGLLYVRRELIERAANQNHFFLARAEPPLKLVPGGMNHELTACLPGIIQYFDDAYGHHFGADHHGLRERMSAMFELIAAHEQRLAQRFLDLLDAHPRVRLLGPRTSDNTRRVPTFSFTVPGREPESIVDAALHERVAIRSGDFYARRCIDAQDLAPGGVVRASMVHYNTDEEVERLVSVLDRSLS